MTEGELRVVIEQLRQEVTSLREITDEYVPRFTTVEGRFARVEQLVDQMFNELIETRLLARELSTNWKLAAAIGALLGTFIIGIVLWVATSG